MSSAPPADFAAEEAVLGAQLLSMPRAFDVDVDPDDFYKPGHRHIAEAIRDVHGEGRPVDPITVADQLNRVGLLDVVGGIEALHCMQNGNGHGPPASNVAQHAAIVKRHARHRRYIHDAGELSGAAMAGDDAAITRALERFSRNGHRPDGWTPPSIEDVWQRLRAGLQPTPPPALLVRSDGTGLIHENVAVMLVGPGGAGKSWLALRTAFTGPMLGRPVVWVDLDNMGVDQLVGRLAQLGVGAARVTSDTFVYIDPADFDDLPTLLAAIEHYESDIVVVDSTIGLLSLAGNRDENDNLAVRAVLQQLRVAANQRSPRTVLVIDHTGHEPGRARGASAKAQWADQVIEVAASTPLGTGRVGRLRLTSRKDRQGGYWPDGTAMADVVVDATEAMTEPFAHLGNSARMSLYAPTDTGEPKVMETIVAALQAAGGESLWSKLREQPPLRSVAGDQQIAARNALRDEGRIKVTEGVRRALTLTLAEDPKP